MSATVSLTGTSEQTGNLATQTHAAVSFGAPAAGRYVLAVIGARYASGAALSGVTIGGVSATVVADNGNDGGTGQRIVLAIALVPTGSSGDVVATYSDTVLRSAAIVYRLTGIDPTPEDTDTDSAESPSLTVTQTVGAVAVAAVVSQENPLPADAHVWSGITEDVAVGAENQITVSTATEPAVASPGDLVVGITVDGDGPRAAMVSFAAASSGSPLLLRRRRQFLAAS